MNITKKHYLFLTILLSCCQSQFETENLYNQYRSNIFRQGIITPRGIDRTIAVDEKNSLCLYSRKECLEPSNYSPLENPKYLSCKKLLGIENSGWSVAALSCKNSAINSYLDSNSNSICISCDSKMGLKNFKSDNVLFDRLFVDHEKKILFFELVIFHRKSNTGECIAVIEKKISNNTESIKLINNLCRNQYEDISENSISDRIEKKYIVSKLLLGKKSTNSLLHKKGIKWEIRINHSDNNYAYFTYLSLLQNQTFLKDIKYHGSANPYHQIIFNDKNESKNENLREVSEHETVYDYRYFLNLIYNGSIKEIYTLKDSEEIAMKISLKIKEEAKNIILVSKTDKIFPLDLIGSEENRILAKEHFYKLLDSPSPRSIFLDKNRCYKFKSKVSSLKKSLTDFKMRSFCSKRR